MLKSDQITVTDDVTLLWEAQINGTKVLVRTASSNSVRLGAKDMTYEVGFSLTANVAREVALEKGNGLYAMANGQPRTVEILVQAPD